MKILFRRAVFFGFTIMLYSCVAPGFGREKPADVAVVEIATRPASVVKTDVFMDNGRLLVTGSLLRRHELKFPGHVDVAVYGPEGLLKNKTVTVSGLLSKRKGIMHLPFSAYFNLVPPPGSIVTVKYHAPPFGDE